MNNNFNDLRAAVVGIGGVGGYIAAMLCKHDKHITLAVAKKVYLKMEYL